MNGINEGLDRVLSKSIVDDLEEMFEHLDKEKKFDILGKSLEMCKCSFPEDKWRYWFDVYENGMHRGKYETKQKQE